MARSTTLKAVSRPRSVMVTGAQGYLGRLVVEALAADQETIETIVAVDLRPPTERLEGVHYATEDIRSERIRDLCAQHQVDTVVHLAAVVSPTQVISRDKQYDIDVNGTRNVVTSMLATGGKKLIVTSSAGAYGYWPDNPALLTEDCPLRGNEAFAYAHHKKLVEEMLAGYRESHPELAQLIFRPGTILGPTVKNQITAIFERPVVVAPRGSDVPFCFVWDQDVVGGILQGVHGEGTGIYNLIGDGVLTLREIAAQLGKPYLEVPTLLLERVLDTLHSMGASHYGAEQLAFLQYRPVPSNQKLKQVFGYTPRMSTREVFELYSRHAMPETVGHRVPEVGTWSRRLLGSHGGWVMGTVGRLRGKLKPSPSLQKEPSPAS